VDGSGVQRYLPANFEREPWKEKAEARNETADFTDCPDEDRELNLKERFTLIRASAASYG